MDFANDFRVKYIFSAHSRDGQMIRLENQYVKLANFPSTGPTHMVSRLDHDSEHTKLDKLRRIIIFMSFDYFNFVEFKNLTIAEIGKFLLQFLHAENLLKIHINIVDNNNDDIDPGNKKVELRPIIC